MRAIRTTIISILAVGLLAGTAVGVAAQNEEAGRSTPAYVTWEVTGDPASFVEGNFDEEAGEMRGLVLSAPVEASDPRLSGLYYFAINGNAENNNTPDYGVVESRSWRIENDGGAWTGTSTYVQAGDGSEDGTPAIIAEAGIFIGEGGYEGLIAVFDSDYREGNQGDAVILELSVPPFPEVPEVPAE